MRIPAPIARFARLATALALACAVTFGLMWSLSALIDTDFVHNSAKPVVKLAISASQHKRNDKNLKNKANVHLMAQAAVEKPKPKPKEIDILDGQVVESAKPLVEKRPENTKYLSRYDSTVAKETKSRHNKTTRADSGLEALDNPSHVQSPQAKQKDPTQIAKMSQPHRRTGVESKPAAVLPVDGPGLRPREVQPGGDQAKTNPSVVEGPMNNLLLPATSISNIAHNWVQKTSGETGSNDALPDVEDEGTVNMLNTKHFKYYDFFQRVKDKVVEVWEPGRVLRERDPNGNRYGVKDRLTVLSVTLAPEGDVKDVKLAKTSSLNFLDDEAKRAFVAAGPFPNPPRGLLNAHGEIEFQFGFLLEISTQRFKFGALRP